MTKRVRRFVVRLGAAMVTLAGMSEPVLAQGGGTPAPLSNVLPDRDWQPRPLGELTEAGLNSRSDLSAQHERVSAAEEVPSRVSSLPDPRLEVSASNFRFDEPQLSGSPMTGLVFGLVQVVPFPTKLLRRGDAASAHTRVEARLLDRDRTQVVMQVRRAYWQLWAAERVERLLMETYGVLNDLANVVHARFSVGQTAQQDALQVQAVQSELRSRVLEQRQRRLSTSRGLERAAALPPTGTSRTTRSPAAPRPMQRDRLVRRALDANPSLRVSRQREEESRLMLDASRADQYPDFFFGAGYRLRASAPGDPSDGADMFSVSLGLTLPVFLPRKQAAAVREWTHRAAADAADTDDLELEVRLELEKALDMLDRLAEQIELYEAELLPETDAALDASITDYQYGNVTLASVLQNWRNDLAARIRMARLRGAYAEQMAVVHALLGDTGSEGPS